MGKWPKLSEEAVSMVLGLVVVLLIFSLIFRYFNRKKGNIEVPGITNMITLAPTGGLERREYQVQKGDSLWKIALKTYGSGYNWVDIQKENKLDNPGMLMVGQKLNLPQTPKREVIFEEYTVIKGDSLWKIAVKQYSDGYRWVDIWRANREVIGNPGLIFGGTKLRLPKVKIAA